MPLDPKFLALTFAALPALAAAQAAPACSAHSSGAAPPVIELYTSEGCNSCPPADRWLSKLKADPRTVALAFHVDYWDRLGWKDRFASPVFSQRQSDQRAVTGARFAYTPQVVIDGIDRPDWPGVALPLAPRASHSGIELLLARDGERVVATVRAAHGAPSSLAAHWAVTEDEHVSAVKAGENEGVTLRHDFVVREWRPVAPFALSPAAPATLVFRSALPAEPGRSRQVNLVVTDARSGRPVQAVKLGC